MITGIYQWTSPSGKSYIGQAINLKKRWREFRKPNSFYTSKGSKIDNARSKYKDFSKWEYKILEECNIDELDEKEKYYINLYQTKTKGYNLTDGGDGTKGRVMEDWQKELCSKIAKERWEKGLNHSWMQDKENLDKLASIGHYERTEEIRNKLSQSVKEYFKTHNSVRSVRCKVYKNNELIGDYPSITQAAKSIGVDQSSVCVAIKKNRDCKGYRFVKE